MKKDAVTQVEFLDEVMKVCLFFDAMIRVELIRLDSGRKAELYFLDDFGKSV